MNTVKDIWFTMSHWVPLIRPTEQLSLILYRNCFAVTKQLFLLLFWALSHRINCGLLFALVAKMLRTFSNPKMYILYIYYIYLYLHTHTHTHAAQPYSFCYLSVYLTGEMFLFHIINLMMVIDYTIATHIRSATIFNARVDSHINTLFVQKEQLYSWQS